MTTCTSITVRFLIVILVNLAWMLFITQKGQAQQPLVLNDRDWRQHDQPFLLPNSDIPSATVRELKFEQNSKDQELTFLSAGDDKVVRRFSVFQVAGKYRIKPQRKYRWPLSKNDLGGMILSMGRRDYDANTKLLAYGGWGTPLRQTIWLANLASDDDVPPLLDTRTPNYQVSALDFHPSRPILAACLNNGSESQITLWSLDNPIPQPAAFATQLKLAKYLRFSPDGAKLIAAELGGNIETWDVDVASASLKGQRRWTKLPTAIRGVAWSQNRRWVAATSGAGLITGDAETGRTDYLENVRLHNATANPVDYYMAFRDAEINPAKDPKYTIKPEKLASVPSKQDLRVRVNGLSFLNGKSFSVPVRKDEYREFRQLSRGGLEIVNLSVVTSIGATADGKLIAFGSYDPERTLWFGSKPATMTIQSSADLQLPKLEDPDFDGTIDAIALSDEGNYLLAAGTSGSQSTGIAGIEIRLWSLKSGKVLARFPDESDLKSIPASGSISGLSYRSSKEGRHVIAFSRGPFSSEMNFIQVKSVGARNLTTAFQLKNPRGFVAPNVDRRETELLGQLVQNDAQVVWRDVSGKQSYGPFPSAKPGTPNSAILQEFGEPICATAFRNKAQQQFLAVGYYRGILIWGVSRVQAGDAVHPSRFGLAICRGLKGHDGATTCLTVDNPLDARLLVSASEDGMISGWSLDGLQAVPEKRNELGIEVKLSQADKKLTVTSVDADHASPGYLAGFSVGQEIVSVDLPSRRTMALPAGIAQDPAAWLQGLRNPVPGEELDVFVVQPKAGGPGAIKPMLRTKALYDPLWTLYPWNDGVNWAIWSPEGFFVASEGSAGFIGWQLNSPLRFTSAETNMDLFRVDAPFDDLLQNNDKKEFLASIKSRSPPINVFASRVTLEEPKLIDDNKVHVQLQATQLGQEKITSLQLWCNSRRVSEWKGDEAVGKTQIVDIDRASLRSGLNRFTAIVESKLGNSTLVKEDQKSYLNPIDSHADRPRPKLHFLGVGVTTLAYLDEWDKSPDRLKPLKFAANDVASLALAFQGITGSDKSQTFAPGRFQLLIDPISVQAMYESILPQPRSRLNQMAKFKPSADGTFQAPTTTNLRNALQDWTEVEPPNPDDLLVILLAGHGFDQTAKMAPANADDFYFVTQDTHPDFQGAITRTEFNSYLSRLPCKTLLLVDTCRAGGICAEVQRDKSRLLGPQILCACAYDQYSCENENAGGRGHGNGVFTAALVELLTGTQLDPQTLQLKPADKRPPEYSDGVLNVQELESYVRRRVPELLKTLKIQDENPQEPQSQTSVTFTTETTVLKVSGEKSP